MTYEEILLFVGRIADISDEARYFLKSKVISGGCGGKGIN